MEITCPECGKETEIDGDDLPECACDEEEWECPHCEAIMNIGWFATAEIR